MQIDPDSLDIEQLIAFEGYEYRMSSGNSGLQINVRDCPKCNRSDWKVYFNAETGLGNCFGCSTNFNKLRFVKEARGFSNFGNVYRYLEDNHQSVSYKPKLAPTSYKLNLDWKLPLNKKILLDEDMPEYLAARTSAKVAKRFDLRICENGFYKYTDWHDRTKHVNFSNRIIIPVYDINGQLSTFQGRDITGQSERKYLFPNMLPGTGRYIYNANYVMKNKYKKIVLNEGAFDVFATTEAIESDIGYSDYAACGTFGKHLSISNINSDDQLSDLFKMRQGGVEEIVMMWDSEPKALMAACDVAIRLQSFGFKVRVAVLPAGCDPAETTKEEILKAIDGAFKPTPLSLVKLRMKLK